MTVLQIKKAVEKTLKILKLDDETKHQLSLRAAEEIATIEIRKLNKLVVKREGRQLSLQVVIADPKLSFAAWCCGSLVAKNGNGHGLTAAELVARNQQLKDAKLGGLSTMQLKELVLSGATGNPAEGWEVLKAQKALKPEELDVDFSREKAVRMCSIRTMSAHQAEQLLGDGTHLTSYEFFFNPLCEDRRIAMAGQLTEEPRYVQTAKGTMAFMELYPIDVDKEFENPRFTVVFWAESSHKLRSLNPVVGDLLAVTGTRRYYAGKGAGAPNLYVSANDRAQIIREIYSAVRNDA